MKKVTIIMAVFISAISFSQSREKGTIELTPLIGYASSTYSGENVENNETVSSVSFGVNADYYFNDRWSLRSSILSQKMGSQFSGYKEELAYITIPLNANWHFGSTRKWNLNFGPSIGFLMSAKANGIDVKKYANPTQIGLSYGIGYKIEVTEDFGILIDFQGMSGLTKVAKDAEVDIFNAHSVFNIGAVLKL